MLWLFSTLKYKENLSYNENLTKMKTQLEVWNFQCCNVSLQDNNAIFTAEFVPVPSWTELHTQTLLFLYIYIYRIGHKSLDKNAFKSQIFLFSLLFLYYKQIVVYNVKTYGLLTYTWCSKCATMLRFSSVVTDLGLPDRGSSATNPVCSNLFSSCE
jgi:hypothetical protein